jgi:archaeal cell division control protein 6
MGTFDDILGHGESLVKNEDALDFEFIPKILPHREKEQRYLATCIKPLFMERTGRNLLIHGPPGIGKTVATKHVLKELEDKTDDIHVIYLNCWQKNTSYKIVVEICDQLGFKFSQNKNTDELFKVIAQIVNKKAAVFAFDEIDKVEDLDFLYRLLENIYKKTIFLITNYKSWLDDLDERIRSRLTLELVEFKPYNALEVKAILKDRLKYAFVPGVWEDDALELAANKSAEIKDVRSGLFILKESAFQAELTASRKIQRGDVEKAISKLDNFTIKNSEDLEEEMQFIYGLVKENSGKKIGDLFEIYQQNEGKSSYKTFQRKIEKLSENKFISTKKQTGAGGNTTIVEKKLTDF